jgi:hypothetical protein
MTDNCWQGKPRSENPADGQQGFASGYNKYTSLLYPLCVKKQYKYGGKMKNKKNTNNLNNKNISLPRRLRVSVGGSGQSVSAIFHNCWPRNKEEKIKIFNSAFNEFQQMLGLTDET